MDNVDKDLDNLKLEVINGKNVIFIVNSLETSRGKTTGTAFAIAEYFGNEKNSLFTASKRFIFVNKFAEECAKIAKTINEKVNANVALAYTTKNEVLENKKYKEHCTNQYRKCIEKSVIVITHAMYMKLCNPQNTMHENFAEEIKENFITLIIDEQIDNVDDSFVDFNQYKYEVILNLFSETQNKELCQVWSNISKPLLQLSKDRINWIKEPGKSDEKRERYKNQMHRIDVIEDKFQVISDEILIKHINYLKDGIEKIDAQLLKDLNREKTVKIDKSSALEIINAVELMHREVINGNVILSLLNDGKSNLYTYDSKFEYIKLKNNIWLDASAKFHSLYSLNKEFFKVVDTERIIDHSECYLNINYSNTSTSSKKKELTKFRTDIVEYIKNNAIKGTKTLIITNDKECQALKEEFFTEEEIKEYNIELTNFKDMKGKNNWEDFGNCFIIQTPRMCFAYYVFLYEYWTKTKLTDDDIFISNGERYQCEFNHKELTKLMEDEMSSHLYQAMKRIARNRNPQGNFYIMSNIYNSINTARIQLHNVNVIETGMKKYKKDNLIDLIEDIRNGDYENEKWEHKKGKKEKVVKKYKYDLKVMLRWIANSISIRDVYELRERVLKKTNLDDMNCYVKGDELIIKAIEE